MALSFDQAYPVLYKGWDRTAAAADFAATGGANKAGYQELVSGGSSGANVTPSSFTQNPVQSAIDIAKTLREQNIQAAQPAIQTLETGKQPLIDRYQKLLEDIKGRRETAVQQAGITSAQEYGRRGIPLSSSAYGGYLQQQTTPVEQAYGGLLTGAEGEREDKLATIRNAIAMLQSGAGNVSMSDALSILTSAKAFEKPAVSPISLGEGATLFDPTTNKPIYTAPKTYAPKETMDLSALMALFGGGAAAPTEPKPTIKPSSSSGSSSGKTGGFSTYNYYG